MAYVISDSCVSCGTCEGQCPVGAISQGDGQYVIDADTCISCGSCAYRRYLRGLIADDCFGLRLPDTGRDIMTAYF